MDLLNNKKYLLELKKAINSGKPSFIVALTLTVLLNSGFTYGKVYSPNLKVALSDEASNIFLYLDNIIYERANRPISEVEKEFLAKYNVEYLDMVKAVTAPVYGVNYSNADVIKERADFSEMKEEFEALTHKKEEYIFQRYNLNYEQLMMLGRRFCNESGGYSYDETYNCISALYNRIFAPAWINDLNSHGYDGYSLYDQFRYPGQFGYGQKTKEEFDDPTKWIGYYAVLDMLSSGIPSHDYTGFRAAWTKGGVQIIEGGNRYRSKLEERVENPTLKDVVFEPQVSLQRINDNFANKFLDDNTFVRVLAKDSNRNA